MDMKCEECGAIIPNGAKVCPNCGCPVGAYSKNNKINKQKFIKSPKIVVVFILLITIIGFSYLYHINNNQNRTSVTNVASEDNKVGDAAYEIGYKLGLRGHINYPLQSTFRMWWDENELGNTDTFEVLTFYNSIFSLFEEGYRNGQQKSKITEESRFWKGDYCYGLKKMYDDFYKVGKNIGKDGKDVDLETLFSMFYIKGFGPIDNDSEEPIFVEKLFEQFKQGYEDGKFSN